MHHNFRIISKQHDRLKKKIASASDASGIIVGEDTHADLVAITSESSNLFEDLPQDSFQRVFWQQQLEAASQKDAQRMRWHPLMIRWCLYLRHRLVS